MEQELRANQQSGLSLDQSHLSVPAQAGTASFPSKLLERAPGHSCASRAHRHGHSSAAYHGMGTQSDNHHQHQAAQAVPTSPGKSQGTVPAGNMDFGSVFL